MVIMTMTENDVVLVKKVIQLECGECGEVQHGDAAADER